MILIQPAYGRKYESIEAMEADWNAGKDFKIVKGPYCSIRDLELLHNMNHDVALVNGAVIKIVKKENESGH